jgi:hypothetical protein
MPCQPQVRAGSGSGHRGRRLQMKARIVTSSVGGAGGGAGAGAGAGVGVGDGRGPEVGNGRCTGILSAWNVVLLSKSVFCGPASATWGCIDTPRVAAVAITRMVRTGLAAVAAATRGWETPAGCAAALLTLETMRGDMAVAFARLS